MLLESDWLMSRTPYYSQQLPLQGLNSPVAFLLGPRLLRSGGKLSIITELRTGMCAPASAS
jgi:hypothetical protein